MSGRVLILVLTVVALQSVPYFAQGQSQNRQADFAGPTETRVLAVHYPRPLAEAAKFLSLHLGLPISYEDPAWEYGPDIEKHGESPARSPNVRADLLGPVFGTLELQFPVSSRTLRPIDSPQFLLERLLAEHVHQKNPGEFRFVQTGDGYTIIPAKCTGAENKPVVCTSPLDSLISFSEETRDAREAVTLVLQTVRNTTGHRIVVSEANSHVLKSGKVTLGATNEVARDVLAKIFKQIRYSDDARLPVQTAWALFYDPDSRLYVLNLREVHEMKPTGGGGAREQPVYVSRP